MISLLLHSDKPAFMNHDSQRRSCSRGEHHGEAISLAAEVIEGAAPPRQPPDQRLGDAWMLLRSTFWWCFTPPLLTRESEQSGMSGVRIAANPRERTEPLPGREESRRSPASDPTAPVVCSIGASGVFLGREQRDKSSVPVASSPPSASAATCSVARR